MSPSELEHIGNMAAVEEIAERDHMTRVFWANVENAERLGMLSEWLYHFLAFIAAGDSVERAAYDASVEWDL